MWLVAPPQTRIHLTIHADGGTADPAIAAVMGSTPVFRDDKKMLPLQAADLLAWHLRRRKEPRYANEIRPAIQRIIGNHLEAEITESVLRTLAKGMAATPGINDTQSKKSSIRKLLKTKWEASNKSGENEDENSNDEKK
jgi:methionine aminopeptidase